MNSFKETMNIINKAVDSIDTDTFNRLLEDCNNIINNKHKIIVSGLGKNVAICDKFVGCMVSLGMPAYFLHTNSAVHGDLGIINDGDLVIILTKSGETVESVHLTKHIQNFENENVNIWLLTFAEESTLTKMIKNKLVINLEHEGDMWNLVPNNSSTLNLLVLQELAMQLAKKRNIPIEVFKRNHPGGHIGEILGENNEE